MDLLLILLLACIVWIISQNLEEPGSMIISVESKVIPFLTDEFIQTHVLKVNCECVLEDTVETLYSTR